MGCHLQAGADGVPLGVARYFRGVLDEAIRQLETGDTGLIEVHSDWLCYAPASAQPVLVATAEHLLYLIFEVVPAMVGRMG